MTTYVLEIPDRQPEVLPGPDLLLVANVMPDGEPIMLEAPTLTIGTLWGESFEYSPGSWSRTDESGPLPWLGYYGTPADPETWVEVMVLSGGTGTVPESLDGETPVLRVVVTNGAEVVTYDVVADAPIDGRNTDFPLPIAEDLWDAQEDTRSSEAPGGPQEVGGHRIFWGSDAISYDDEAYQLRVYSGPTSGGVADDSNTRAVNEDFWVSGYSHPVDQESVAGMTTNNPMSVGLTCHNALFWKRLSDGEYQQASAGQKSFTLLGLDADPGDPPPDPPPGDVLQEITFDGFTYGLSAETEVYYAPTGDPMVVGPVTIVSATPAYTSSPYARNGAELNFAMAGTHVVSGSGIMGGVKSQGFDNASSNVTNTMAYSAALNVDPGKDGPLTISQGTFVKSETLSSPPTSARPSIKRIGLLTVLPEGTTVPAGAFRPGPYSAVKAITYTTFDLAHPDDFFPYLTATSGAPSFSAISSQLRRVKPMQWLYGDHGRRHYASDNLPSVYRGGRIGLASWAADAALLMCCNISTADKITMRNYFVQLGIDVYDRFQDWPNEKAIEGGGLTPGDKIFLVMAALFTGDEGMADLAADLSIWHEDRQLFVVGSQHVGMTPFQPSDASVTHQTYQSGDLGMPEWGEQPARSSNRMCRNLNGKYGGTYRFTNGGLMGVAALGHIVPEIRAIWANPILWDYIDRLTNAHLTYPDTSNCPTEFARSMFSTYRDSLGTTRVWGPDWS